MLELEQALRAAEAQIERLKERLSQKGLESPDPIGMAGANPEDAVQALLDSREALALVNAAPEMIVVVDQDGRILLWNEKAEGLADEGAFPLCFQEPGLVEEIHQQGFVGVDQGRLCLSDGRMVLLSCAPLVFRGRSCVQYHLRDVTSASLLSDELQLVRRMAAVGNLAAEVAHAINNPLSVVMGRVELLQALPPERLAESGRHLEVMADYARRMAHIIKGLQIFARPGLGEIQQKNLLEILQAARASCVERDDTIRIELDVEPSGLNVRADPVQLVQVFDGLMSSLAASSGRRSVLEVNARVGGLGVVIGMEASNHAVGRPAVGAGVVWKSVETSQDSIGFGVSVGSAILREHGGALSIGGDAPEDRCYRVELPGWSNVPAETAKGRLGSGERVLVVEDEHGVRELAVDMLVAAGYAPVSVENAEAGLVRLESMDFSAILVDINLPAMSGLAFREAVLSRWPQYASRIILMTGLDIGPPAGVPMLRKPFSQASLLEAIGGMPGSYAAPS